MNHLTLKLPQLLIKLQFHLF
uniref:Uncharacterized protein n=1 Tax=Anguilla anguilla TaxID=7936 RepID=A0A0E9TMP5_ANGAN